MARIFFVPGRYGSKESFQDFVKGEFREDLAKALSTQLPFGYLLLLLTPYVSMSCEYMLAMLKTNISWNSLMIYICAITIGFNIFWTLAALLLMVDLCDRCAPRRFGCFDHVQTFLILLLVVPWWQLLASLKLRASVENRCPTWKGSSIFRCYVSFWECEYYMHHY